MTNIAFLNGVEMVLTFTRRGDAVMTARTTTR